MRIPYFKNIFKRTNLSTGVRQNESGIMNLENAEGSDIAWNTQKERTVQYISTLSTIFERIVRYLENNVTQIDIILCLINVMIKVIVVNYACRIVVSMNG